MKVRYDGLTSEKAEDKFLVPAVGYRSVSGVASAAAFAIWYHFHREGREVCRERLKAACLDALHMDQHIGRDAVSRFDRCYFAFTVEEES